MGYHTPQVHAAAVTSEDRYVQTHEAAVDRTINSREYRLGVTTYERTGQVPQDKFWTGLAKLDAKNPSLFAATHPLYTGFFTPPARLGELPSGNVVFDVMRERDQSQHSTFLSHHPFYIGLVDRDLTLRALPLTPAPASATVLGATVGASRAAATSPATAASPSLGEGLTTATGSPSSGLIDPGTLTPVTSPTTSGGSGSTLGPGTTLGAGSTSGTGAGSSSGMGSTTGPDLGSGSTGPSLGFPGSSPNIAVPEPASALMVAIGVVATFALRRAMGRPSA